MSSPGHPSRRQFLTSSAALLAVPYIIPRSVFGANERIITGHVGLGGQGGSNLKNIMKLSTLAEPAALCDVDRNHLDAIQKVVQSGKTPKKCDGYNDYRALLDRKDIDAVVVSPPTTGTP
jgi:hypothetical protein